MKLLFTLFIAIIANSIFAQCDDNEYSTIGILDNIGEEIYNDDESVNAYSIYSWMSDDVNRILSGNGIPNHEVGTFPNPNCPNAISEQSINQTFSLCPSIVSETGVQVAGPGGTIAYAVNSVKFDPGTAGRCNDDGECSLAQGEGQWNIEALGHETFDFGDDMNHAHVQPSGAYHYHGMPELLIDLIGEDEELTLVGWASDGFPVYARYGYSDANDPSSDIISLQPSWRLKTEPDEGRPDTLTALLGGPGGTTYPNIPIEMGAFTQDFEYIEGYGDLDECNGRIGVTPEFPEGIYYYMVTDDFPFFSRCLKGEFSGGGGGIGPSLINFSIYADTVNTSEGPVSVGYVIEAEDSDNFLSNYILRLIINGGPIHGGELLESSGDFNEGTMSSSIAGVIEIPVGSTEGQWNIRIILENDLGAITNLGPNDLANQNFQNYIFVNNVVLGINDYDDIPIQYSLGQNYPNPFNPVTKIDFTVAKESFVNITIFDISGNKIKDLINTYYRPSHRSIQWNATNDQGEPVSAGVYFYRIQAGDYVNTKKMIFLK